MHTEQWARRQVTEAELEVARSKSREQTQPGTVWNVWYNSWAGGDRVFKPSRAPFRCRLKRDAGKTRGANKVICLWFARGMCSAGPDCKYAHRAPNPALGDGRASSTDIFGRSKFMAHSHDYRGIGSFNHTNKTLYVGIISRKSNAAVLVKQIRTQFEEWGPVTSVRAKPGARYGFVTYEQECYAQFAKEAMSAQTLTGNEILDIRWAAPSQTNAFANTPGSADSTQTEQEAMATVRALLGDELEEVTSEPIGGKDEGHEITDSSIQDSLPKPQQVEPETTDSKQHLQHGTSSENKESVNEKAVVAVGDDKESQDADKGCSTKRTVSDDLSEKGTQTKKPRKALVDYD